DLAGEPTGSGITSSTNSDNIISGLDPDTDYNFYIRSICSGAPGDWSSPFPFRTLCTVKNMPYFTDFTTGSTEGREPCWNVMDLNHRSEEHTSNSSDVSISYAVFCLKK